MKENRQERLKFSTHSVAVRLPILYKCRFLSLPNSRSKEAKVVIRTSRFRCSETTCTATLARMTQQMRQMQKNGYPALVQVDECSDDARKLVARVRLVGSWKRSDPLKVLLRPEQ